MSYFKGPRTDDLPEDGTSTHLKKIVRYRALKRLTPVKDIRARYKSFRVKKK